ncbi:tRNA pseudouridine(38/39) synthase [Orchesella cincta]|uniref:Chloride channel CLIC-like protein 1 n=1 Tax=Orchesella cincta TaxID=48709 RepID=A0A1D2MP78_ORCCI|nr:tRNA pseudouridine(38/39) synthase [Orchesella cincta]
MKDNSKLDYENWSKEDLIKKIRKLECHVEQLRNVITKRSNSKKCVLEVEGKRKRDDDGEESNENLAESSERRVKKPRPFDFSRHSFRHVALKFLYLGWDYQGLACQEDTNETIEAQLFRALTVTKLIEERSKSNYNRCGRTDKGVSAFQQVISIDLRSKIVDGQETIDYCNTLNRVLPRDIRAIAWSPVRPDFSARFDCIRRTYRYFFPRGGLNLQKMQIAANHLIGEHDFQNLCKQDKDKTTMRRVIRADIVAPDGDSALDMCKLIIVGGSFVWHQIRCIAAVLILVGKELEEPEVVTELLNLEKYPRKPQYSMAVDYPLVLYDVQYHENDISWIYPKTPLSIVLSDLQTIWSEHSVKSTMISEMIQDLELHADLVPTDHVNCLLMGTKRKAYQKMSERPTLIGICLASSEDYINFADMENYDYSVQRNIDKKMSQYGMVPTRSRAEPDDSGCNYIASEGCLRSMEYLQRIVKSLLRQMNVHSHNFGPGEAITIDLQAEIKFDDYIVLTKFMKAKDESDKYLHRIDEIMSNFIRVVDHSSSRFEFVETIVNFPAFHSLKFWIILLTSMVIGSLIIMLFFKAFHTSRVTVQLTYGFLIIFIVSCVWTFSHLYEDKKAEVMAHMIQNNDAPPKDCHYQSFDPDECVEYYSKTMTDPFWKVNPMQAISKSVAFFVFEPLGYIGGKLGQFYYGVIQDVPLYWQPILFATAVFFTVLLIYGPFRISTPLLSIEPAWRPMVPALDRGHEVQAIGHQRIRNEIMERPDGPIVKSIRDASTDMDGFHEYLTDEGTDELEIIGPFARFKLEENYSRELATCKSSIDVIQVQQVKEDDVVSTLTKLNIIEKTDDPDSSLGEIKLRSIIVEEEPPDDGIEDEIKLIPSKSVVP